MKGLQITQPQDGIIYMQYAENAKTEEREDEIYNKFYEKSKESD